MFKSIIPSLRSFQCSIRSMSRHYERKDLQIGSFNRWLNFLNQGTEGLYMYIDDSEKLLNEIHSTPCKNIKELVPLDKFNFQRVYKRYFDVTIRKNKELGINNSPLDVARMELYRNVNKTRLELKRNMKNGRQYFYYVEKIDDKN